jgi:diguanylate cyclase (GGDEF)-like protein
VTYVVGVLAALVAFQYLIIGAYVVPRIGHRGPQVGVTLFCLGAAATHASIALRAFEREFYDLSTTSLVFDRAVPLVIQLLGGLVFLYMVTTKLELIFSHKGAAALLKEKDALMERLQELATTDSLTGLLNRHAFDVQMERHMEYIQRYGAQGGVVYLDLDGFKDVNDTHGHRAGDTVLKMVADALRTAVRTTDEIGRMGGDEFAVLLRDAGPQEIEGTAERIVREIRRTVPRITASVGVASCMRWTNALDAADHAMYDAKRAGGDRYAVARGDDGPSDRGDGPRRVSERQ